MIDIIRWDNSGWHGKLKIRAIPKEWTAEDYDYWWKPREVYSPGHKLAGQVKVPPRLSEEEKDNLTIWEGPNTLLVAGVNNVLSYVVAQGSGPGVMFQYMAFGNGSISSIDTQASSLSSEFARKAVSSVINYGAQGTITVVTGTGDAVGNWTNVGWFGINATGTANSGTLMSQVLIFPAFSKGAVQYSNDYLVGLVSD